MMLRYWLRRNLWRRGLRWLCEHTQLLGRFLLPSLFPRLPVITPENPAGTSVVRDGREVRVVSSEPVSVETNYVDWITPLMQLPEDSTSAEWKAAVEKLVGDNAAGPLLFPATAYLDSLKSINTLDVELVHRCRASRLPLLDAPEPSVILVYNQKDPAARPK